MNQGRVLKRVFGSFLLLKFDCATTLPIVTRSFCLLRSSPTAPFRQSNSVNELQCHSVNVRANCASTFFLPACSCRMHWSQAECRSKACVSIPDGRGHSWPPTAVGKVHREVAVDHGTCHAFLYMCTKIFCIHSNSQCDHSMRATEKRKASIPFCAKSSAASSGVNRWLLIRSRATLAFSRTTSLAALSSKFPVPK